MSNRLYQRAINVYGEENQMRVAGEELLELAVEISKYLRVDHTGFRREKMIEEMADVFIMLEQAQMILKVNDAEIFSMMGKKLQKLDTKVEERERFIRDHGSGEYHLNLAKIEVGPLMSAVPKTHFKSVGDVLLLFESISELRGICDHVCINVNDDDDIQKIVSDLYFLRDEFRDLGEFYDYEAFEDRIGRIKYKANFPHTISFHNSKNPVAKIHRACIVDLFRKED